MILLAVLNPVYAGPGIELPYLMSLDLLQPVLTRCVGRMGGTMYDRSNPDVLEFVERQAHFDLPNYNTDPFATEATVQAALAQEYITLINGELAGMGRPLRFEFLGPTTPTGSSLLRTNQPLWPDRCKWPAPQAAGQPVTVFLGTVVVHCLTTAPLGAEKAFGPSPSRNRTSSSLR